MSQRKQRSAGFAVYDLLVLLVVVMMLLAMLYPLILRARKTSLEIRCMNNLRQLGIACHNIHNDFNIFPTGGGNAEQGRAFLRNKKPERNAPLGGVLPRGAEPLVPPEQEWGWAYQILPYIELQALWANPQDDVIRQTIIPPYFCPARRQPQANEKNQKGLLMAGIDYAGNGGVTGPITEFNEFKKLGYTPPYKDWTASGAVIRSSAWYPGDQRRAVSLANIPDGSSNTILLTEKRMQTATIGKNPRNDDWSFADGWGNDTIVRYHPEEEKLHPAPDGKDPVADFQMGSAHDRGFAALFVDASVRRIRYTVNPVALAAAMIRNEGLRIAPGDLE
ncbi:MAG: DUF1559 domain-containing protein [Gemmatales bacterium]|nr:DUF1559 domain-containing protein [Gemmatales bacterium]MDW8176533.1 DUF1559 domain-containing protein [Gemmatales bacterium]